MAEIKSYGQWKVAKLESFQDAQKYGCQAWGICADQNMFDSYNKDGEIYILRKSKEELYAYQPSTGLLADKNDSPIKDVEGFLNDNAELKPAFEETPEEPAAEETPEEKPEETSTPVKDESAVAQNIQSTEKPMKESLNGIYETMLAERKKKRDITSSTVDLVAKSHPKSPIILDYEAELFGLDPEEVKRLPIKSIEMLKLALTNLISATKDDTVLRNALRHYITASVDKVEEEIDGDGNVIDPLNMEEAKSVDAFAGYKNFLEQLSESKATKFNYKMLLDLDPTKIMNPFFIQLLTTFELTELTRPQKQGVLIFLKKLADLADTNNQIAQALNRIVRLEGAKEEAPIQESKMVEAEKFLTEGLLDSTITPATLLSGLGIPKSKAEDLASVLGYGSWADVEKLYDPKNPTKLNKVVQSAIRNAGGTQKFISLLSNSKISTLGTKLAAKF